MHGSNTIRTPYATASCVMNNHSEQLLLLRLHPGLRYAVLRTPDRRTSIRLSGVRRTAAMLAPDGVFGIRGVRAAASNAPAPLGP